MSQQFLHFGAQRGARDPPAYSGQDTNFEERRRCILETIKEKELELQELNATYGEEYDVRPRSSSSCFSSEQLHEIVQ